ncbi:MAG: type II toxin-antitoxin system VapC family toxin [Actinomycetota bacterium]
MSVVVDASLVVALVVADERQAAVQARFEGWLESGEELPAPPVLPYEVANVLARLAFDGDLKGDDITDTYTWADLAALDIVLHPFDLTRDGPAVAAITARLRRRHATDSTDIHLAQRIGTTFWSLDGALARSSAAAGLPVELVT